MIGELLKVGDVVVVNIPKENWDWGYNPVGQQTGYEAKVTGFGEIHNSRIQCYCREPGVYSNYAWMRLEGVENSIGSFCLEMKDQEEQKRRRKTWDYATFKENDKPLRPLPEMDFWEGDVVDVRWARENPWKDVGEFRIAHINYDYLGQTCNDNITPMPQYTIEPNTDERGGTTSVRESELTLVRRGNVWKYFNGEKPEFKDVADEATFFKTLGHYKEMRNPANKLYKWEKDEILQAIKDGTVDGMAVGSVLFTTAVSQSAIRFKDRELGERVRRETLNGFGMECAA